MEKYVVIDLETTGHTATKGDRIIEIGAVVIAGDQITDQFASFFHPGKPIPPFIANLTGIQDDDVAEAPYFHQKAGEIKNLFAESYFIAHNVPFDLGFLNVELANAGQNQLHNPVLDTVELARILYPQAPGYKLGQLADYLDISHEDPHRALSDAYVTAKLFLNLKEKLASLPYETIAHLIRLEKMFKSDVYSLLEERQQALAFSAEERSDIDTYSGLGFKRIEQLETEASSVNISYGDYLDDIYEMDGSMAERMSKYEKRKGQRDMSETIHDAFQSREHALIEAETGTGKSLAYLIPAVYESVRTKKRIVISTYTTQLQSQLLEEEIPLIRTLIDFPFQAAILKGKSHYLSLEKFAQELDSPQQDNYDIVLTKAKLLVWITETETGDKDEIQLPLSGYLFFKRISTDAEGSIDPRSPWFGRSYYQKALKKARKSDIIITNHSLLCTDMFNDYQFLPSYDKAIIDEAHHLEETASRHYGLKLDYINMQYVFNQLGSTDEGKSFSKLLERAELNEEDFPAEKWDDAFIDGRYELDDLFRALFTYVAEQKRNNKSLSDVGRTQYRFENGKEPTDRWEPIKEMVTRSTFFMRDMIHVLSVAEVQAEKKDTLQQTEKDMIRRNMEILQTFIDQLERLFLLEEDGTKEVKWIEMEAYGAKNAVYLYNEPTDISGLLAADFFAVKESVVLTSATLTMRNSFSFIQDRLGLPAERLVTEKIISPFSYQDQVQLMVPTDFPDIKYSSQEEFIYATCEAIISLAEITSGRMLVLFTSYDMLRKAHRLLKETLDIDKYVLIAQGISSGSRTRLKKNFQTFNEAILLGTSSFWEGVDIPGEDLSCLMIVRLPFQPPDHPVYEAKSSHMKEQGKNAFFELSLPNAVIRFKQGFGRLIRSTSDRGIVFVCDARLTKARYGKYFTESIPDVPTTVDSTNKLIQKAKEWF